MSKPEQHLDPSLGGKMAKGGIWMILMRFSLRGLGFVNTIVLARILVPEDFGLIAMAMLVVSLVQVFSDVGLNLSILRKAEVSDEQLNTAWTIKLILALIMSSAVLVAAPFAAEFFSEPRVSEVLRIMALVSLLAGLSNIGVVLFTKELEFHKAFYFGVATKTIGVTVSIGLAIWLRNYWALVIGLVFQQFIGTLGSYLVHPFRPRITLASYHDFKMDTVFFFFKNIASYIAMKADELIIGKLGGAATLGIYYIPKSIANMLTTELAFPIGNAALPGYSKMLGNPDQLNTAFERVIATVAIIACSAGFGLWVIADNFVLVVFGDSWLEASGMLQIFAIGGVLSAMHTVTGSIFMAIDRVKILAQLSWVNLLVFVIIMTPAALTKDITWIALAVVVTNAIILLMAAGLIIRYTKMTIFTWLGVLRSPLISSLVMILIVRAMQSLYVSVNVWTLIADILIGGLSFISSMLFLWWIGGKREGPESTVFYWIKNKIGIIR